MIIGGGIEAPVGWTTAALSDLGQWFGGGTPSKQRSDFWSGGDVPWVSPKDMKSLLISDTEDHISELALEETVVHRFPAGSIAFVVRSGILEHTLPVAQILVEATANQDMRVLAPAPQLNAKWLLYAVLAEAPSIRTACQKDGTTVASIDVPKLSAWNLAVPPRGEQDRIVAAVDRLLAEVESGMADLAVALGEATALRIAIIRDALQGDWPVAPLEDALLSLRNGMFVSRPATEPPGVRIFRISAVRPMSLNTNDVRYAPVAESDVGDFLVSEGDLLFTRYSGNPEYVGACARVRSLPGPTLHPDKLIRAVVNRDIADPVFLEIACSAGETLDAIRASRKTTAGQVGIAGGQLKRVPVPLPPIATQSQIATVVAARLQQADAVVEELRSLQASTATLWSAVVRHGVTGGFELADSSDSPAAMLLEEVAAALRAAAEATKKTKAAAKKLRAKAAGA